MIILTKWKSNSKWRKDVKKGPGGGGLEKTIDQKFGALDIGKSTGEMLDIQFAVG